MIEERRFLHFLRACLFGCHMRCKNMCFIAVLVICFICLLQCLSVSHEVWRWNLVLHISLTMVVIIFLLFPQPTSTCLLNWISS